MKKEILKNGTIVWRNAKGNVDRDDGPAVTHAQCNARWVEVYDYEKEEMTDSALIKTNKYAWYIDGKEYTFKDWCYIKNKSEEEIVQYKLCYDVNEWEVTKGNLRDLTDKMIRNPGFSDRADSS